MRRDMKIEDDYYSIGLIVFDMALIIMVDVPIMPYPKNVIIIATDGFYISYRFLMFGTPWYMCFKSMILTLLMAMYMINKQKS